MEYFAFAKVPNLLSDWASEMWDKLIDPCLRVRLLPDCIVYLGYSWILDSWLIKLFEETFCFGPSETTLNFIFLLFLNSSYIYPLMSRFIKFSMVKPETNSPFLRDRFTACSDSSLISFCKYFVVTFSTIPYKCYSCLSKSLILTWDDIRFGIWPLSTQSFIYWPIFELWTNNLRFMFKISSYSLSLQFSNTKFNSYTFCSWVIWLPQNLQISSWQRACAFSNVSNFL